MEWVRACSLAQPASPLLPECCRRASQPVPGPAELTISGNPRAVLVIRSYSPDFLPALHQLMPFPVGWAVTLPCDVGARLSVHGLAEPLLGSLLTLQILGSPAGAAHGFLHVLCSISPPVRESGTLEKKARICPHLEEATHPSY